MYTHTHTHTHTQTYTCTPKHIHACLTGKALAAHYQTIITCSFVSSAYIYDGRTDAYIIDYMCVRTATNTSSWEIYVQTHTRCHTDKKAATGRLSMSLAALLFASDPCMCLYAHVCTMMGIPSLLKWVPKKTCLCVHSRAEEPSGKVTAT